MSYRIPLICLALVSILGSPALAQLGESDAPRNLEHEIGPLLGDSNVSYWEFGLKIQSQGNASGIIATIPIPVDWREQQVKVVQENRTDNLKKLTYNNITKPMKQLVIKANRLAPGETAQASVVFRIDKRDIDPPVDPKRLRFASSPPSRVRPFLRPSPYIESNHPRIKALVKEEFDFGDEVSDYEQVEKIYDWVRSHVEYEFDPVIHECLDALDAGKGDCEELSSLFIAFCRAKQIPARAVWIPGHTYPEFYMEDDQEQGHWIPCQAAGDYCFGAMPEVRPILQKGDKFKVPGSKKPLRYVQPMLTAKDASGGISIEWINRRLSEQDVAEILTDQ
ncbi:MAG: transglutaminase domain-containing protein [Planctomycetota bacterium]|nr:transglutaminase domain-containing protein [Planctomycetota bacterium]